MVSLKSDKVFDNIPSTSISNFMTTIPLVLRQALGITEENQKEFEVRWSVEHEDKIVISIIKTREVK